MSELNDLDALARKHRYSIRVKELENKDLLDKEPEKYPFFEIYDEMLHEQSGPFIEKGVLFKGELNDLIDSLSIEDKYIVFGKLPNDLISWKICLISELNNLEKYYVDLYGCFNSKNGLNLKDGGGSKGNVSEETKIKISNATKGRIGKKKTIEQKLEQSIRQNGRIASEETKIKMSLAKIGKKKSNETSQRFLR